tara:strand:- start:218 stop:739 length:522 start_codon:yes stop_codon:yes gene_type:complete
MPSSVYSFTSCNPPPDGVYPNANGVSPIHGHNAVHGGATSAEKGILGRGWAKNTVPKGTRAIGSFRYFNNAGDPLSRDNYAGVQNTSQCMSQLGGGVGKMHSPRCRRGRSEINTSGVETFSGNPTYVYDSSNYMTYKKQRAMNKGYIDPNNRVYTEGGGSRCESISARNRSRK